eukprot:TRINITY_DN1164_c0_g1_i5.p1 TRINITY_DN1164_c0_g1~~TRINITY_DN1164_c0_g1_i5.p1  ORF type:complete len:614 (+),score=244.12 TRINITY_DN1164_c0_g1_i5:96-1844(+)
MAETVSFKASKLHDGENEVRRFQVDKDVSTSYAYLQTKLAAVFPDLKRKLFAVMWTDSDADTVTIATDDDLIIALTEMEGPVYKIAVQVKGEADGGDEEMDSNTHHQGTGDLHEGVTCDGCQGVVRGFRYKCMACPDYDLCAQCEQNGVHAEHNMIRMVKPMPAWPHHFFKKFQRMQERAEKKGARASCHQDQEEACSSREGDGNPFGFQSWCFNPRGGVRGGPRGGFPPRGGRGGPCGGGPMRGGRGAGPRGGGMPPFFGGPNPFEGMMNGWGWAGRTAGANNCHRPSYPQQQTSAANDSGAAAATNNNDKKNGEFEKSDAAEAARQQAAEYLNNIGQFVAAALDPFGIDVDVSVETAKEKEKTASEPSAATNDDDASSKSSAESEVSASAAATAPFVATAATAAATTAAAATAAAVADTNDQMVMEVIEPEKEKHAAATSMETDACSTGGDSNDGEWTVIKDNEQQQEQQLYPNLQKEINTSAAETEVAKESDEPMTVAPTTVATDALPSTAAAAAAAAAATPSSSTAQHQEILDPKIQVALQAMTNMGFTNEGGWLTTLLEAKQGDIGKVLDLLQPVRK